MQAENFKCLKGTASYDLSCSGFVPYGVIEAGIWCMKEDVQLVGGTVALLGDDKIVRNNWTYLSLVPVFAFVGVWPVQKKDNVGVLLNGTRFTQVMQGRFRLGFFRTAV